MERRKEKSQISCDAGWRPRLGDTERERERVAATALPRVWQVRRHARAVPECFSAEIPPLNPRGQCPKLSGTWDDEEAITVRVGDRLGRGGERVAGWRGDRNAAVEVAEARGRRSSR